MRGDRWPPSPRAALGSYTMGTGQRHLLAPRDGNVETGLMKRVYGEADTTGDGGGFLVILDGRPARTPAGARLILPTRALARAVAEEWQAQGAEVEPASMPLTRLAVTAIDRITPRRQRVIDEIAAYGASDLLCYRAEAPPELVARQRAAWRPLLQMAARRFRAELEVTQGVAPVRQEAGALAALRGAVAAHEEMPLAALREASALTGSVVIALLLAAAEIDAQAAWSAALVDETFQAERWGEDEEAVRVREGRRREFFAAARFMALCGP